MTVLRVTWQRLVSDGGQTCPRCGATESAVNDAVEELGRALAGVGIEVVLDRHTLSQSAFLEDPLESNRIWIAGVPLEAWLAATVGQSTCCSACGDAGCRTLVVGDSIHEAIACELIVRAGILAAADIIKAEDGGECCASPDTADDVRGCCNGPPRCA